MPGFQTFVFFFSSRRRHTRCLNDWSSDVCSSDLASACPRRTDRRAVGMQTRWFRPGQSLIALVDYDAFYRSLNEATIIGNVSLPAQFLLSEIGRASCRERV